MVGARGFPARRRAGPASGRFAHDRHLARLRRPKCLGRSLHPPTVGASNLSPLHLKMSAWLDAYRTFWVISDPFDHKTVTLLIDALGCAL